MIRVLIADDSPVIQRTLVSILGNEPGITVVGVAGNGAEAVRMCSELRPDLVTMDIFMPEMNGLDATREIMKRSPTRIVIISSMANAADQRLSFEAIDAGAVEVIEKPHGVMRGDYSGVKARLVERLKKMMVSVPERRFPGQSPGVVPPARRASSAKQAPVVTRTSPADRTEIPKNFAPFVVCFGGSTGATPVLADVLRNLPAAYPVPVVITQHIARGFVGGMAGWLSQNIAMKVRVAEPGDRLEPGRVLIAPDNEHLVVSSGGFVTTVEPVPSDRHVPSIDRLLFSVADVFRSRSLGFILSGMGRDGCKGLLKMREVGAVTIAQSAASAVVYGMPMVAMQEKAAMREMDPGEMVELLLRLASVDHTN